MNRNTRRQVGRPAPADSLRRVGTALETSVPPHSCLTKHEVGLRPAACAAMRRPTPPTSASPASHSTLWDTSACSPSRSSPRNALPVPRCAPSGGPAATGILDLSENSFSSAIPGSLFTKEHYLSRNAFSGQIPPQIASLTSLSWLELYRNVLSRNLSRLGAMRVLCCRWCLSWRAATPPARCAAQTSSCCTSQSPVSHSRTHRRSSCVWASTGPIVKFP
jgi:hypothetical protein